MPSSVARHRARSESAAQRWRDSPQPPRGLRLRSASIDAIDAGGMPSSLRSPPGPIRVSSGLPARSAVLSSTPARSGRRVQQLHPADTCGRRRRQVVSRASSHIRAVGFPESNPDGSGPEAASKPDVDPVPDPAVSAAADPEVRWVGGQPLSGSALDGEAIANQIVSALRFTAEPACSGPFEPDRVGVRVRCAQPPLSKKDRIDFAALDRPQHAVRLDRRPRAGAARSRATDQAVARGGGQGRSRSGAARSRSVRAGLTRCACRRPVWRNGRSAVVMAQRSPPSPIPPSSAIPTPTTEPTGIVVLALVHEITRTTSMFRPDTDGRRRVFTSATYAVSSVLRGFVHRGLVVD